MIKKLLALFTCLCFCLCFCGTVSNVALSATGQPTSLVDRLSGGMRAINLKQAQAQLLFLSSDAMQGRQTGTPAAAGAADYIVKELKRMGYKPSEDAFTAKGLGMRNIRIEIPGTDTSCVVVVGAHYDHVGVDATGDVYNGADDNASGVVAVLQLAQAFRKTAHKPKATILLCFWDGEENGLNGSKHFTATYASLRKVIGYVNFDMIGRNTDESQPKLCRYLYTDAYPALAAYGAESVADFGLSQLTLDYKPLDRPSGSDNVPFMQKGIPIAWYHTDGHVDYHKPSDTSDKINWAKMMDIIRSSYVVTWRLSENGTSAPKQEL